MHAKPTYEDLEKKIHALENELEKYRLKEVSPQKKETEQPPEKSDNTDIIWIMDLEQNKLTHISPSVQSRTGYTPDEIKLRPLYQLLTPASFELVTKVFLGEAAKKNFATIDYIKPRTVQIEEIHKDGSAVWSEVTMHFIRNENGKIINIFGLSREISARQEVAEVLWESEEKFKTIFENANDEIVYMDINGNVIDVNKKVEEIFGYKREEVIGKNFIDFGFINPKDLQNIVDRFTDMIKGDEPTLLELEVNRKDGTAVFVEANPQLIKKDGNIIGVLTIIRDTSERKKAEQAIRANEEQFKTIFENANDVIIYTGTDGTIIDVNDKIEDIFGYKRKEVIAKNFTDFGFIKPEERRQITALFEIILLKGKTPEMLEIEALRKDGTPVYVEVNSKLIEKDDEIKGIINIIRDISERKQTEDALRESEEKFKTIFENANDIIVYTSPEGIVIDTNEKIEEFGYTRDEVIGKNFAEFEIFKSDDLKRGLNYFNDTLAGKTRQMMEFEIFRKDKSNVFVEVNSNLIEKNGNVEGIINIIRNISERKRAEAVIIASEKRYRDIVENINDALYTVTADGIFTYISSSLEHIAGYKSSEIIGSYFGDFIYPEDRPALETIMREVLAGKTKSYESRYIKKSGEIGWIYFSSNPVFVNDKIFGIHGIISDITQRKQAEKEKESLEAQLQYAKKMESIGTLSGGIAHNFNNLLMAIQGNISLMLLDTEPDAPNYNEMKSIEQCVESGAMLTKQLLGFARGGKYSVSTVNMNDVVQKTSSLFTYTAKNVTIHENYQDDLWAVDVDQGQIEQVLVNLYVNAWHAMPEGGELYLSTENVVLDETYKKPFIIKFGKFVKISATDTGIGMDKATQNKIFEPFFTTKEVGEGTGLGLASAFGIIKNHGGLINCYSELNTGTTINIYIPASEKAVTIEEPVTLKLIEGSGTVLLVDDEPTVLEVGELMLQQLGYSVIKAEGGQKAIDMFTLNKNNIDLVILDMIMPDKSGKETYIEIKKIKPDIKVVLSSGYSMTKSVIDILDQGCSSFIQKPFTIHKLSQEIKKVLD